MEFQNFVSMNVAIIGSGKITENLAAGLLAAGHKIYFGINEDNLLISNNNLFLSKDVQVCSIDEAGSIADIIIMSCDPLELRASAYFLDDVKRKVIIDCVVTGGKLSMEEQQQHLHSVNAIRSITGSPHVVKWLYAADQDGMKKKMSYGSLKMYVAGDSKKGKMITNLLARDLGYEECYDLGGTDKVTLLESMVSYRKKSDSEKTKKQKV